MKHATHQPTEKELAVLREDVAALEQAEEEVRGLYAERDKLDKRIRAASDKADALRAKTRCKAVSRCFREKYHVGIHHV